MPFLLFFAAFEHFCFARKIKEGGVSRAFPFLRDVLTK
jgi:hypothetical protein